MRILRATGSPCYRTIASAACGVWRIVLDSRWLAFGVESVHLWLYWINVINKPVTLFTIVTDCYLRVRGTFRVLRLRQIVTYQALPDLSLCSVRSRKYPKVDTEP